ncbi:hypothetical protein GY45DRAFT_1330601 [Cubamyces sp. BRFM 1775]|nr:hypothetical protein GY45DRAFT_1330601 [Cubamyces sp. BRFM 1775]
MSTPTPFAGGTYILFNVHHGTALTASNDAAVVGEPYAEAKLPFQQWEFIPFSSGFVIRPLSHASKGGPAYLAFEGTLRDSQATKLEAQPMVWNVTCKIDDTTSSEVIRISTQGFHVDLDWHKGRVVQLIHYKTAENCQRWYTRRCGFTACLRRSLVDPHLVGRSDPEQNDAVVRIHVAPGPGPHVLLNSEAGTALDVSAVGRRAIKCCAMHKERNQQWELIPIGDTTNHAIRSGIEAFDGRPLYLTVEAPTRESATVVASPYPVPWRIERNRMDLSDDTYRLYWLGTNLVIAVDGTQEGAGVRLAGLSPDKGQLWHAVSL